MLISQLQSVQKLKCKNDFYEGSCAGLFLDQQQGLPANMWIHVCLNKTQNYYFNHLIKE